ncbi:hypothetical protein HPULCUR_003754 [Helicostylum pulchrum]|uniref:Uncharacterized protein n=1 Tax=Helicostylum pulchrum TaxID=562976 RepID=A0ABP9XWC7_9FUNG
MSMVEVYDLHRHTHYVAFCIREDIIECAILSTTGRRNGNVSSTTEASYITYDSQKLKALYRGRGHSFDYEDVVEIDLCQEKIYRLFKKGKDSWNKDDLFLFQAVSDFLHLSVKGLMNKQDETLKRPEDTDALHYVFVVPSEWEEEIREVLIRPIFVQANLISKDDHKDRLLFCTDVESTYYYATKYLSDNIKLSRNTIIGVITIVEESKVSIKLDSILIGNPLFDFSNSLLFPKLMASNSSFLTTNDVKNGIREFIKIKFSFDAQEETIQNIMEEINHDGEYEILEEHKAVYLERPFITDESISELDKKHEALIKSIRVIDICTEISKHLPNNLKLLLPNNLVKEYSLLNLTFWSEYLFEYNRIYFGSNYIIPKCLSITDFEHSNVLEGAVRYLFDALRNSDLYSKPRILSTKQLATSSSIFLKSKPDAIMNIDISFESTTLSYSFLDENGLVKEICNHNYFVPDTRLRALGSFFSFSEVTTLNVKSSFIDISDINNKKTNLAQLHEDYVQLTLNQVVTDSGLENEYQETVIIQEEIIPIPNIYDTLCFNMWSNITEDSCLIQLCDTHKGHDDYELLERFSLGNLVKFTKNLKEFISKNILNKTLNEQTTDKAIFYLSTLCNCRVCLTVNDITEISFRPALQDIVSLVFTSLINKQLFGKYRNIQYVFHLIRFNYNPQFQHILMKILKDETDEFLYEEGIDIAHYTLPKLSSQLLQPVLQQEPFSYKAFQVGVLYHVYSENYGIIFEAKSSDTPYWFKPSRSYSDSTSESDPIDEMIVFPLFKKGNKINRTQLKQEFYLSYGLDDMYIITRK